MVPGGGIEPPTRGFSSYESESKNPFKINNLGKSLRLSFQFRKKPRLSRLFSCFWRISLRFFGKAAQRKTPHAETVWRRDQQVGLGLTEWVNFFYGLILALVKKIRKHLRGRARPGESESRSVPCSVAGLYVLPGTVRSRWQGWGCLAGLAA